MERIEKLRRLKKKDPKQYWKIVNTEKKTGRTNAPLNDLYNFYKAASKHDDDNYDDDDNDDNDDDVQNAHANERFAMLNEELNVSITSEEILQATKALKNNKSPGLDNILNEHLKSTITVMSPLYVKLFNVIFDKSIVPETLTLGNIKPIFKNKGNPKDPENYRPITLLSNFGKLFTAILNNRLNKIADKYDIIRGSQSGFRKHFPTTDNLFILKSLIDISASSKKKFIHSMYQNIKSKVTNDEGSSQFFDCNVGVRQGENLSPFLFSIFLNDLDGYFVSKNVSSLELDVNSDDIHIFLKLLLLLYADDTIIFSNDSEQLQNAMNVFDNYCKKWHLTVNIQKTNIVIFSKGRANRDYRFLFRAEHIEIVKEYKYLGVFLGQSGSYVSAKKHIIEQANKASFALMKKYEI